MKLGLIFVLCIRPLAVFFDCFVVEKSKDNKVEKRKMMGGENLEIDGKKWFLMSFL